jgi:hypothetical protein
MSLNEEAGTEIIRKSLEKKEVDRVLDSLLEDQEFRDVFLRKVRLSSLNKQESIITIYVPFFECIYCLHVLNEISSSFF